MRRSLCRGGAAQFGLGLWLAGCVAVEVGWDIDKGRRYLMMGEPRLALVEFQKIAAVEPDYNITSFSVFPEGIWTYIGRSYYELGELGPARAALERSVKEGNAMLGFVYLGLVEMREGDPRQGIQTALVGLRRLEAWFRKLEADYPFAKYWDRRGEVRSETSGLIRALEGGKAAWQQIALELERLGDRMDDEVNVAGALREQAINLAERAATE